ncbi:MAG TPA: deoxyribose-phosphate aldolase [Candidatus Mcinerneyibacteriales bacterium]|nr:deoxyribose-phosphate aldolase [Candidatus Mcinerneyibacteriales bacterium]
MKKELWQERVIELRDLLTRGLVERRESLTETEMREAAEPLEISALAQAIDHTLLDPFAREEDISRVCAEVAHFGIGAVCLFPCWIPLAKQIRDELKGTFHICVVIDFPGGGELTVTRVKAVENAFKRGCDEVDIVIPLSLFLSGNYMAVLEDLLAVREAAPGIVKVILEMSRLSPLRKKDAALIAFVSGADFLKTSTGVNGKAAEEDVRLLRDLAGKMCGVKAAGGIRSRHEAFSMLKAGADRIGSSAGPLLLKEPTLHE